MNNVIRGEKGNALAVLEVVGEIYIAGGSLFGTEALLYERDKLIHYFICCANGFFYFDLDYEKQYNIVLKKEGYTKKIICFDTFLFWKTPVKRRFDFGVSLNKIVPGLETIDEPAGLIKYSALTDRFQLEHRETEQMSVKRKKIII